MSAGSDRKRRSWFPRITKKSRSDPGSERASTAYDSPALSTLAGGPSPRPGGIIQPSICKPNAHGAPSSPAKPARPALVVAVSFAAQASCADRGESLITTLFLNPVSSYGGFATVLGFGGAAPALENEACGAASTSEAPGGQLTSGYGTTDSSPAQSHSAPVWRMAESTLLASPAPPRAAHEQQQLRGSDSSDGTAPTLGLGAAPRGRTLPAGLFPGMLNSSTGDSTVVRPPSGASGAEPSRGSLHPSPPTPGGRDGGPSFSRFGNESAVSRDTNCVSMFASSVTPPPLWYGMSAILGDSGTGADPSRRGDAQISPYHSARAASHIHSPAAHSLRAPAGTADLTRPGGQGGNRSAAGGVARYDAGFDMLLRSGAGVPGQPAGPGFSRSLVGSTPRSPDDSSPWMTATSVPSREAACGQATTSPHLSTEANAAPGLHPRLPISPDSSPNPCPQSAALLAMAQPSPPPPGFADDDRHAHEHASVLAARAEAHLAVAARLLRDLKAQPLGYQPSFSAMRLALDLYDAVGLDEDPDLVSPTKFQARLQRYRFPPPNMSELMDVEEPDEATMVFMLGELEARRRRRHAAKIRDSAAVTTAQPGILTATTRGHGAAVSVGPPWARKEEIRGHRRAVSASAMPYGLDSPTDNSEDESDAAERAPPGSILGRRRAAVESSNIF